jgi:hypothetical protein
MADLISIVVGAATFDAAKLVFGIVCWVGAAIQVLGFLAVSRVWIRSLLRSSRP